MFILVAFTCSQTTYQNNSYFSNPNYPSTYDATGSCQLTVNKASSNVCQLRCGAKYVFILHNVNSFINKFNRLDFFVMVLVQPEGNDSLCNRDQFIVTGGSRVPSICGTNTGQHSEI